MALKKSELYSSLWSSCDELRGGMDASQYKDYVLVLLFIKYVSDKYTGLPFAPITIPDGASFADMVALKGKSDIGDQINKTIIAPLANANKLSDMPDFNDATKLGTGKEMVDRLTNLIAIFENRARASFTRPPRSAASSRRSSASVTPRPAPPPPSTTPPVGPARCCSRSATRPLLLSRSTDRIKTLPPAASRG